MGLWSYVLSDSTGKDATALFFLNGTTCRSLEFTQKLWTAMKLPKLRQFVLVAGWAGTDRFIDADGIRHAYQLR